MRIVLGEKDNCTVSVDIDKLSCPHELIVGKSGSGKTVQIQRQIIQIANNGGTVLLIDIHDAFADSQILPCLIEGIKSVLNLQDVAKIGMSIPLFSKDEKESSASGSLMVSILCSVFRLGDRQRAELRKACQHVAENGMYEHLGASAVYDVLNAMDTSVSIGLAEKLYDILAVGLLSDGEFFLEKGKINVLRLSGLDTDVQRIYAEFIIAYCWQLAIRGEFIGNPLTLVLDEAQNYDLFKKSGLAKLLTEGRKLGVNLLIATQFLPNSTENKKRFLQSGLVLYFRPADSEISEVAKTISHVKAGSIRLKLLDLKQGEFIVSGDLSSGALFLENHEIYTPKKVNGRV